VKKFDDVLAVSIQHTQVTDRHKTTASILWPGSRAPGRRGVCSGLNRLAVWRCLGSRHQRSDEAPARVKTVATELTVLLRFAISCSFIRTGHVACAWVVC